MGRHPFSHGLGSLASVTTATQQLQVIGMVSAATGTGHDMIHVHYPEWEVSLTTSTYPFLLPIESMPVGSIIG